MELCVKVESDPGRQLITVDLRDNCDCLPCGLNLTESTARTSAMIGVFTGLGQVVPPNAGSFRRVEVHLREGCVVGIPRHQYSCSAATTNLAALVANLVTGAIAELGEGCGMAAAGRSQPPSCAVISGSDPRDDDAPYVNQLMLAATGGPGGPRADGWVTMLGIGSAGFLLRDSVEIDEMKYPIRVIEQRVLIDSEGAGRRRGSPAAYVEFGPVDCSMDVVYLSDGTYNAPVGVRGGWNGSCAQQRQRFTDGSESDELGPFARLLLKPGESIISVCCSGAGYGPPREREIGRVLGDVEAGLVSRSRASDVYGVVIDADGKVDAAATARSRNG
ncbi:MAG: hydantoinase B/oxoprolinase family protein, partial [Solirubrobacteraceae bacterium]